MADFTKEEREQYEIFLKEFFEAGERNLSMHSLHREIAALRAQLAARDAEVGRLRERLKRATELCASQAEDEGLWFIAETITEDYLQRALRALHRVIEE